MVRDHMIERAFWLFYQNVAKKKVKIKSLTLFSMLIKNTHFDRLATLLLGI